MHVSRDRLQQIIIEEYLLEEGVVDEAMTREKTDEFIAWIKKEGPKPEWLEREYGPGSYRRGKNAPSSSDVDRAADTMPIPRDDDPESEYSGFQDRSGPPEEMSDEDIVASISDMVQGLDPEHVSGLFQAVFAQIPGVEMGDAEEDPESLYSPGAEGRPAISLGPIREHLAAKSFEKILEIAGLSYGTHSIAGVPGARDEDEEVDEGHYHDMGGEGEMYNALDPHGFDNMSDAELIDAMHTDGMEEIIVLDGEGDLANREEVIAALKNV